MRNIFNSGYQKAFMIQHVDGEGRSKYIRIMRWLNRRYSNNYLPYKNGTSSNP